MGPDAQDSLQARAIEWLVRLRHGDGPTWDAFAEWLAEDPRHAAAYEAIEQADLAIEPLLPGLIFSEAANDADRPAVGRPSRVRSWVLAGGAVAASLATVNVIWGPLGAGRYEIVTKPGENRVVRLDASTEVRLNGSTHMTFDRNNPRFASLTSGEALFRVRHDSGTPFTLEIGDRRVEDAGTLFNVVRDAASVRVAVAEGKIVYNPERNAITLHAGQALVAPAAGGPVRITRTAIGAVGAWRDGRLVYSGEPLSQVAADLGRSLGVDITVSPPIADRPFYGAIVLDRSGAGQLRRLAPALDVALDSRPGGWTMKPVGGPHS
jgi:transmembrane sensor